LRDSFVKKYVSARAWYQLMKLFDRHYEVLSESPLALAYTYVAYLRLADEARIRQMTNCVAASEHAEWITDRAMDCAILCGYVHHLLDSESFLKHVRDCCRQRWLGVLWDLCGTEVAYSEVARVPFHEMSEAERRVWGYCLLDRGELSAVEALIEQKGDSALEAFLRFRQGRLGEALAIYQEMSQSSDEWRKQHGQRGAKFIERRIGVPLRE
jgi:hypothetical protein